MYFLSWFGPWKLLTRVLHLVLDLDMVIGLWYNHDPNFGSLSWFWRCKEHPCPLSHHLGFWRMPEVPDRGLASWSWFWYGHWSLIHPYSEFWLSIWTFKLKENLCQLSPDLGLLRMLEVSDLFVASWSWFWYGHWPSTHQWSKFGLSILILKVQRTSMSFKSSFGALECAGGSWLGFDIMILIWIWTLVLDTAASV